MASTFCLRNNSQVDGELIGSDCYGSRPALVLVSDATTGVQLLNALQGTLQESWVLHTETRGRLTHCAHLLDVPSTQQQPASQQQQEGLLFALRDSSELLVWQRRSTAIDAMPGWHLGAPVAHLSTRLKRLRDVMQAVCVFKDATVKVLNVKDRKVIAVLPPQQQEQCVWSDVMLIRTLPAILVIVKVDGVGYALRVVRMNWQAGDEPHELEDEPDQKRSKHVPQVQSSRIVAAAKNAHLLELHLGSSHPLEAPAGATKIASCCFDGRTCTMTVFWEGVAMMTSFKFEFQGLFQGSGPVKTTSRSLPRLMLQKNECWSCAWRDPHTVALAARRTADEESVSVFIFNTTYCTLMDTVLIPVTEKTPRVVSLSLTEDGSRAALCLANSLHIITTVPSTTSLLGAMGSLQVTAQQCGSATAPPEPASAIRIQSLIHSRDVKQLRTVIKSSPSIPQNDLVSVIVFALEGQHWSLLDAALISVKAADQALKRSLMRNLNADSALAFFKHLTKHFVQDSITGVSDRSDKPSKVPLPVTLFWTTALIDSQTPMMLMSKEVCVEAARLKARIEQEITAVETLKAMRIMLKNSKLLKSQVESKAEYALEFLSFESNKAKK